MANRFPLIVNSSANQIQELAAGDNLDLSSSNISNVGNVTVFTNLTAATLTGSLTTGAQPNITSVGNLTVANVTTLTVSGTANVANLVPTKYNEVVVAGGSTGAATISPNVASGTIFNYTLTGNITLSTLTNAVAGSGATIILTQDGTGNRTLTSTMKFLGNSKTLSTAAGAIDIMSVFYDGTTYYASLGKGYA